MLCDTGIGGAATCPAGSKYPKVSTDVVMHKLPTTLTTMPDPCKGVPANAWCPSRSS